MVNKIPVTNDPRQAFTTQVVDKTVEFSITWNGREKKWIMDIRVFGINEKTQTEMYAKCIPISNGLNLLQYYELDIGKIYGFDSSIISAKPTRDNFGITYFLYLDDGVS